MAQQVECFVPVGSEGIFDDGGLMEVGTVDYCECEGLEGEEECENEPTDELLILSGYAWIRMPSPCSPVRYQAMRRSAESLKEVKKSM